MRKIDVLILGAGISGLASALKSRIVGRESVIFEARDRAGGLLDNFVVQGFRFDNAVHLSFASESDVRTIFDKTNFFTHSADAKSYELNKWLKHPVQNNLYPLDAEEKVHLISSFLERPDFIGENYKDWLNQQYGYALSERYPLRYTRKYWDTPAEQLSTTWIGDRMRRAKLDEILLGAFTENTPNTYYLKEVRYPKYGGFRSFIEPLISEACIEYNHEVSNLNVESKTVTFTNGVSIQYSTLISSIPLPALVSITDNVPNNVIKASQSLTCTSIDLVSVGFNKKVVDDLWFYIYDEDILASRAYSPSNKSPDNAPPGCSSLQFEIYTRGNKSKYTKEFLVENVLYAIEKMQIASVDDILFTHHKHLPYGNVIFDIEMEENRRLARSIYKSPDVQLIGRFGEWDYLWSNQSFMSGYNVVL